MGVRVNINVNVNVKGMKQFKEALDVLRGTDVLVGIPAEKADRKEGPITNAALAYIHDNGSPAANIPARPFMAPGIKEAKSVIERLMMKGGKEVLAGNKKAVEATMESVGLAAQRSVRGYITNGSFLPLKERTLRARRRRGRTGTKPLIDTGQLRNAINYVVRKKVKK